MRVVKNKKTFVSNEKVISMESVQIQYTERDVDLDRIKRIASASARRIQKDDDERLLKALENHDSYYIRKELRNVSTYDLIKMILQKMF